MEEMKVYTKDKEANIMPAIELIEYERVTYVREMEDYLQNLKNMKKCDAQKRSYDNLVQSEIITESGEFAERYEFTRLTLQKKG